MLATTTRTIRLAFSPDADDLFMFWALLHGEIDDRGLRWVHEKVHTEDLNARTLQADPPEVCAVSIGHLPAIADRFLLLPHGASIGRGYGPVVVARRPMNVSDLRGVRVGIPGRRTTAHLVLRLLVAAATGTPAADAYRAIEIPITPFARIFDALAADEVDAALLIHEGRLTYRDNPDLHLVVELGEGWQQMTSLPLPLGGNVVRRDLPTELLENISAACRESIDWALVHRDHVLDAILSSGARAEVAPTRARLDRYLAMYANDDSAVFRPDALEGVRTLLRLGAAAGLLAPAEVHLAP